MGDKSGIEWTDATWNPVTGCTKVSQGCKHCYAERDWSRLAHLPAYQGRAFTDVACHPDRLDQPLRWAKPRRIFVNSMSDLFHEDVADEFIDEVFAVMSLTPRHEFQILTKRPDRMRAYMRRIDASPLLLDIARRVISNTRGIVSFRYDFAWPLPHVWLGVSVEDQAAADQRIPLLLQTLAAVRWISAEPLLGPIELHALPHLHGYGSPHCSECGYPVTIDALNGYTACGPSACDGPRVATLDWVVVGGESGPKARPMHPDWARSLRDQCAAAGVPFVFKQWGEWSPQGDTLLHGKIDARLIEKAHIYYGTTAGFCPAEGVFRFGKKAAGRLLDGELHDGYPEVAK